MARRGRTIAASPGPAYHRRAVNTDPSALAWRELALRELQGAPLERLEWRSADGLRALPLYPSQPTPLPGRALLLAGEGWRVCPEYAQPDPARAGAEIAADLQRGAQAVWIRIDERLASGVGGASAPVGLHGVVVRDADELATLLAGVDLASTPVTLAVGAAGRAAAGLLEVAATRRGVALAGLRGLLGCDPLGALAQRGALAWPIEQALLDMSEVAGWARRAAPGLRAALVDVGMYHDAGAGAVDQIAALLATGALYLKTLVDGGASVDEAAGQIGFASAVGRDVFLEIAKLRAMRLVWARLVGACGGSGASRMQLHARGAWRERTTVDPWVGLLRGTGEAFAAAVGGADTIAVTAMDAALGEPGPLGRRMALNTQLILAEESGLARVADPGGGAGYVEALTDQLARAAWVRFQEIERAGGMARALRDGLVQGWVAASAAAQAQAVATVKLPIVGVSRFAAAQERATGAARVDDDLVHGTGLGGHVLADRGAEVAPALVRARLAEPFEALRVGAGELVALVAVGTPAQSRARVEFCRGYFGVGGLTVCETAGAEDVDAAVQQFKDTGARAAVICSADALYPELVPALAPKLQAAGAVVVLLAGRPKELEATLAAAGIDLCVQFGGDAVALLGELKRRLEVHP